MTDPVIRYWISHRTTYRYGAVMTGGHSLLHLVPRATGGQEVVSAVVRSEPEADEVATWLDAFDNLTTYFGVHHPHEMLEVATVSEVVVREPRVPDGPGPAWEDVAPQLAVDVSADGLLARVCCVGSPLVEPDPGVAAYAAPSFPPGRPVVDALAELTSRIFSDFTFDPAFSDVSTPLGEVLEHRRGVCQDFAHLAIGCLRSVGLPARYVSGYIETEPPPGQPKLVGADASHAWCASYLPGWGWLDLDPTNDQVAPACHVTVAWGRDYHDVAPVRGVVVGPAAPQELSVAVDVGRVQSFAASAGDSPAPEVRGRKARWTARFAQTSCTAPLAGVTSVAAGGFGNRSGPHEVVRSVMTSVTVTARPRLVTAPFVIVTLATLAFFVFVGMAVTTLPRFIEHQLGGDGLAIGINLAMFSVAAIAARPMIARIGDRYGRRTLMVGGSLLAAAAVASTAFVSSLAAMLPLRALSGVGEAALFVGAATLIADLSPSDRRAEGASYFSLAVFGGLGVGPVVGQVVLDHGSYRAVFLTAALACLTAALISLAAPNRVAGVAEAPADRPHRVFHPAAVLPGLVLACAIAGFAAFNAFLPTHAEALGMPASGPFVVYSVVCLGLRLLGARLPERMGLGNALTSALVGLSIGLLVLAVVTQPRGVYLGTVVLSMGMALLYPSLMAFAVNSVSEEDRALVLASFTMFFEVGTVAGGLILGSIARFTGEQGAFAGGAVMAMTGIWVLRRRLLPVAHLRQPLLAAPAAPVFDGGLSVGE